MSRRFFAISILFLIPIILAFSRWEQTASQSPAAGYDQWKSVLVHPLDASKIITASSRAVFEKTPGGPWIDLWQPAGLKNRIRRLIHFKQRRSLLFALTDNGVFQGNLDDKNWRQIFRGTTASEKTATAMTMTGENPARWVVGTGAGLFESTDEGRTWTRSPLAGSSRVEFLHSADGRLFIGMRNRLFICDDRTVAQPVLTLQPGSDTEEPAEEPAGDAVSADEESEKLSQTEIRVLAESPDKIGRLWLATGHGIFESRDAGLEWSRLATDGLLSEDITDLVCEPKSGRLFAGTPQGIYSLLPGTEKRWKSLDTDFELARVRGMALAGDDPGSLIALTEQGLARYPLTPPAAGPEPSPVFWIRGQAVQLFGELTRLEPSVHELHQAVIHYANLGNGKVNRWQWESRLRSLVPTFSVGRDFSKGNTIDIDRGGTNDADRYILGPDNLDENWGMDLSWDLGDLIWSSNQTSIDSRQKLAVELRHDLLTEATRVYFERRRIQMDLLFSTRLSCRDYFEKLMRMDELTSHLDGMSGGFFRKKLESVYAGHPGLNGLWNYEEECSDEFSEGDSASR